MARGKKESGSQAKKPGGPPPDVPPPADALTVGEWTGHKRPVYRTFSGPRIADVALRVAVEREPFAELTAHAKESLDREVCGVLVGDVCEDDEGPFLHIKAIIRGLAAKQGSTHVTYTQETWNQIHEAMETRYPKMQIVGWYHSHPGYGVEFSEMDTFIQKNFFSAPSQIGLVTDPLGGQLGVCINADDRIKYIGQIWVDGREQKCFVPQSAQAAAGSSTVASRAADERLEAVEHRLNQTLQALDELRTTIYRFALTLGMMVGVGVILGIGYWMYNSYAHPLRPPQLRNFAPVPIQIGDKTVVLGVGVVSWEVPPELVPKVQQEETPATAPDKRPADSQSPANPTSPQNANP
ncbi:MAG: Mov34/MPN/PAD-1 family protein [Blastocatellia bacterium]